MPGRIDSAMVTSALELPGYRIVRNFGIVRGIIVRSRSVIGNLGAALQTIVGGNITSEDEANTILAAGRADLCLLRTQVFQPVTE